MKKILFYSSVLITTVLASCSTTKQLSPNEMKSMTTKQFEADYDVTFRAAISLLQSEGFLVESSNKETGLINANKRIEQKKFGYQEAASMSKLMVYIDAINNTLTEVKLTIYEGSHTKESVWASSYGNQRTKDKEAMVQDAAIYGAWFNNLRAEIERRKASR